MTVAPATATEIPAALREDGTLKLVIFDCDGVLVDGEHAAPQFYQKGSHVDLSAAV